MKNKTIMIMFLCLVLFTVVYTFIIYTFNIGVMDVRTYMDGVCNFKYLGDGFTQLKNCAIYRIKW